MTWLARRGHPKDHPPPITGLFRGGGALAERTGPMCRDCHGFGGHFNGHVYGHGRRRVCLMCGGRGWVGDNR